MALAFVVDGAVVPTLVLLLVCLFLAIYTVRVSPGLLAFWITAVLALLYGLIGQFSVATLVLRVEETAIGAALGMLAGFLILPTGTRAAFGTALDAVVDAAHAVLDAAVDRILGRPVAVAPVELARDLDAALGVLRLRARPLDNPLPRRRGRSSYARAVRVFTAVDHYARLLARLSDTARAPDWAETLTPAVERIRTNIDGLRALVMHADGPDVVSAERAVDRAEAHAAHDPDPELRRQLLVAARLLRRMDQAVYGFALDLGAPQPETTRRGRVGPTQSEEGAPAATQSAEGASPADQISTRTPGAARSNPGGTMTSSGTRSWIDERPRPSSASSMPLRRICSTLVTPACPPAAMPHRYARPIITALRTEREGLDDVAAAADAAVQQDLDLVPDGLGDRGQGADRGGGAVEVVAAVVGHRDRGDACVDGPPGVVRVHDPLHHEGAVPLLAKPGHVRPGRQRGAHPLAVGAEERRGLLTGGGEVRRGEVGEAAAARPLQHVAAAAASPPGRTAGSS